MRRLLVTSKFPRPSAGCLFAFARNIVVGNSSRGIVKSNVTVWNEMTPLEYNHHPARLPAGKLLYMLDTASGHAVDTVLRRIREVHDKCRDVTVGGANTIFVSPVYTGQAIRLEGRVIHVGESSMTSYVRFFTEDPITQKVTVAGETFFTFVTVDEKRKTFKVVPAIQLDDPFEIALHNRYCKIKAFQQEQRAKAKEVPKMLSVEEVNDTANRQKMRHVSIESTKFRTNRMFFNFFNNNGGSVFGGELLSSMEHTAIHCARKFTRNRHVYTIAMHSVSFDQSVVGSDYMTLEAKIVYVHHTTMEIEVTLTAKKLNNETVVTNTAAFVVINTNEMNQKVYISTGLDLEAASQEELRACSEAQRRYHNSRKRSQNLLAEYK